MAHPARRRPSRTELETHGAVIGNVWIEKVVTSPVAPTRLDARPGALDELATIIDSEIHGSTEYRRRKTPDSYHRR
ncbi:hypothetical protein FHX08_003913 [Rhizobium sp. BK529]|uniref:hypothetical protein n=1 Tax=unclassified Rhizobium TaxID=2613769 RepID=UPI0018525E1C|nr:MULTISPECIES: hypothetical protein [unclassified Rhizobium]MBB3593510.1 hypothetical protein [Rhizobium sp. BK529]